MRVVFYASNPLGERALRLEHEITELQRASIREGGRRIDFVFLPALPFEDLQEQIDRWKPTILHISAHGTDEELTLSNTREESISLSAEALKALVGSSPPKVVYINACSSAEIASKLTDTVSFAIGTTAPIKNLAARKGVVNFYRSLIEGDSVAKAFQSTKTTVETLSGGSVTTGIFYAPINDPASTILYRKPKIVAHFVDHDFKMRKSKLFDFEVGISGAPPGTFQVIVCTDDWYSIDHDDDADDMMQKLCDFCRVNPIQGEVWVESQWTEIEGDMRIFAFGSTTEGETFSTAGTLCEALETFYKVFFNSSDGSAFPPDLKIALAKLRYNDGAKLRPNEQEYDDLAPAPKAPLKKTKKTVGDQ